MTQFTLSNQPTRIVNFGTSGPGNDFLVYVAQFLNHEDAANNYDATHNGTDIPGMPGAGGGGTYVESVSQLSPSQRQTYDVLVVAQTGIIILVILAVVVWVATRKGVRRVRHGSR